MGERDRMVPSALEIRYSSPVYDDLWPCADWASRLIQQGGARSARLRMRRSWRQVGDVLRAVATDWLKPGDPLRGEAEAAVVRGHGLAPGLVHETFTRWLRRVAAGELFDLWERELGATDADCIQSLFAVFAGTLAEPAIQTVCHALMMRTFLLGRASLREWGAVAAWMRAVARADPELGSSVVLATWPTACSQWTQAACAGAEGTLVFGGDAAVAALRAWTPPDRRFSARGHRVSVIGVTSDVAENEFADLAERISLDMVIHDQKGCLSPQYCFVEDRQGVRAGRLAESLADALRMRGRVWPAPPLGEDEMVAWRLALERWRVESALGAGVFAFEEPAGAGRFGVMYHPELERLPGNPVHRFMHVIAVRDGAEAARLLQPLHGRIAAVAHAGKWMDFTAWLGDEWDAADLSIRVCAPGEMQDPPLIWQDGGCPNLREWVRA